KGDGGIYLLVTMRTVLLYLLAATIAYGCAPHSPNKPGRKPLPCPTIPVSTQQQCNDLAAKLGNTLECASPDQTVTPIACPNGYKIGLMDPTPNSVTPSSVTCDATTKEWLLDNTLLSELEKTSGKLTVTCFKL
ncbi:hypothetical protein PFISCL1PPCAC_11659, partial [Pristionchus fissidentatus]